MKKVVLTFALILGVFSIFSFAPFKDAEITSKRNFNVCKKLKGRVLVYVVFVETKQTSTWDDFDINTTRDSINKAVKWIEKQAEKSNVSDLSFDVEYYRNDTSQYIYQNLSTPVKKILSKPEGAVEINAWTDKIAKKIAGVKNRERLIAKLRDEHNVESVVLMFMVNNYYRAGYSYTLNTQSVDDVEYSLIGTKEPTLIASEIMSLFGAHYMYSHPSVLDKKNRAKLKEIFPYDIMASPEKPIGQLYVGEITQYYLGWKDEINAEYDNIIKENKYKY